MKDSRKLSESDLKCQSHEISIANHEISSGGKNP